MGGLGGQLPPQFDKTRKFSLKVGIFFGGIEIAMKKQVTVKKKSFQRNEQQAKYTSPKEYS